MKRRNLILTTLLVGSLAAGGYATASQAGSYCKHRDGGHAERMNYGKDRHDPVKHLMRQVDLSEGQQAEIKAIVESSRESNKLAREQMRDSRKAMHDLATSDSYNIEQVRILADQQAKLSADLTVARIDSMHRVQQVLTPDQQNKLSELRAQRKDRKNWKEERSNN